MKINEVIKENFKVTKNDQTGVTLTKPDGTSITIPAEHLAALQSNPNNPSQFSINPDVFSATDTTNQNPQEPVGPKVGSDVEIDTTDIQTTETMGDEDLIVSPKGKKQNKTVGGDPTDRFIDQVTDKEFERNARGKLRESDELNAMLTIAGLK